MILRGLFSAALALLVACGGSAPDKGTGEALRPAGAGEMLFQESFENDRLHERGWYDGSRFKISGVSPQAGRGCIEYHWPAGATTPNTTTTVRRLFEPVERVHVRFYLHLSRGWGWTGRPYHPHLIQLMTTEDEKYRGPASSHLTLYIEPQNGRLRLATQDIRNKDAPHGLTQGPLKGGYNGQFFDSRDVLFTDDRWHRVEAEFKLNGLDLKRDRALPNGEVRAWFDGRLVVERKGLILRSTDFPNMRINQILLAPYFGPGLLPHTQTLWIDELELSKHGPESARG